MSFPLKSAIQRKGETDNVGKNVGKDVGKNLSPRQLQILELVTENPEISIAEMAKIIGVTTRTIERETPKMDAILRHIGPKNGGHWEIIGNE